MKKDTHTTTAPKNEDLEYGRSIIRDEIAAVSQVADRLDSRFSETVQTILQAPPGARVMVSGMGKAGFVGMKLSATLASIGFSSFFVHPADAVHGDLGRFAAGDIAILLSHSGETDEVIRLLPTLKSFGSPIIAITASASSSLGQHSSIVIEMGKCIEAGPLGLAPTTSTTVMMAIGDALAMTLVYRRGFTREEYAIFHPGGDLGRSLMLIREIMRTGDAHCVVHERISTREALHSITQTPGRPGAAAIVNDAGILVGVFTDGDLRRCLEHDTLFLEKPIGEIGSRNPRSIGSDRLAQEAGRMMQEFKLDQIIVTDENKHPVGLVDIQDLLSYGMIRTNKGC